MKNYILFFAMLSLTNCDDGFPIGADRSYVITIYNNSPNLIYCYSGFEYPDTSINEKNSLLVINPFDNKTKQSSNEWDRVFAARNASKISFFFLSPDTIIKYGWDIIKSDYKVLKREDFSLQELKNGSYTVSYP